MSRNAVAAICTTTVISMIVEAYAVITRPRPQLKVDFSSTEKLVIVKLSFDWSNSCLGKWLYAV